MPPGCGIFSISNTFAPASCAVIAEMPPAAPKPTTMNVDFFVPVNLPVVCHC